MPEYVSVVQDVHRGSNVNLIIVSGPSPSHPDEYFDDFVLDPKDNLLIDVIINP